MVDSFTLFFACCRETLADPCGVVNDIKPSLFINILLHCHQLWLYFSFMLSQAETLNNAVQVASHPQSNSYACPDAFKVARVRAERRETLISKRMLCELYRTRATPKLQCILSHRKLCVSASSSGKWIKLTHLFYIQ